MEYRTYPFLNKPISAFIYGGDGDMLRHGEDCQQLLDDMFSLGINTMDTARGYGKSEEVIGKWLKGKNREEVVIISKCCLPAFGFIDRVRVKNIRKDLEKSLQALNTPYIDILYLHRDSLSQKVGPFVEEMNALIQEGKIKAFGVSNWTAKRIKEANDYAKEHNLQGISVSSPCFSLAEMVKDTWKGSAGCVSIQGESRKEEREFYKDTQIPVFPYSSLGRGFFSGRYAHDDEEFKKNLDFFAKGQYCYPVNLERLKRAEELAKEKGCSVAQINFAFLLNQDFPVHPVVSSKSKKRMDENIHSLEIHLTKEEIVYLDTGVR